MKLNRTAAMCVLLFLAVSESQAEGVPAGTVIDNAATVSFDLDGVPTTVSSNTTSLTVVERIDVALTVQSPQRLVTAGSTDQVILYRVVNTGNGTEAFSLAVNSIIAGDDFDPLPSSVSLYFDTDGSGDLTAGDEAYVPDVNDPVLDADASIDVLVLNDIPAAEVNGAIGRTELIVTSRTGTGAPGTNFPGQGDAGVDAVIGTSSGNITAGGEYLVSDVQISITKTQSIVDPFGGDEAIPGATITYTINVEVTGGGVATASTVRDEIPQFTSYVENSLQLDGIELSDVADADEGELDTVGIPTVVVRTGDLNSADGVRVVEFQVLID